MRKDSAHDHRCHCHAAATPTPTVSRPGGPDLGPARHLSCRECGATHRARPVLRLRRVLRPARGRLRVRRRDPRVDRGRPAEHLALPAICCRSRRPCATPRTSSPAAPRWCRPTTWPASSACARCGSRTTAPTRRTRSRTGSSASRWPPRVSSASPPWPARRPATSPTPSRPPRPAPASGRSCSSPRTSSSRRSSRPPCTAATLVAVEGNYDDVNRVASELAGEHEDWAFVNVNVRPYYAEGSKTLGYEVAEGLGWRLPQQVVIPVASGSQLTKVDKAFGELVALGLVDESPYKIFGAQATGCSPVSAAFKAGHDVVTPGPAGHDRQVAGHRQPGRRAVRARHRPAHGRAGRGRHRRGGRRRASGCWPAPRASSPRPRAA